MDYPACQMEAFYKMMEEEILTDMSIVCGDRKWKVHRIVMYAASDFVAGYIRHCSNLDNIEVDLSEFSAAAVECLVKFAYTGQIRLQRNEEWMSLLIACDYLGMHHALTKLTPGFYDWVKQNRDCIFEVVTQEFCPLELRDLCTSLLLDDASAGAFATDSFRNTSVPELCRLLARAKFRTDVRRINYPRQEMALYRLLMRHLAVDPPERVRLVGEYVAALQPRNLPANFADVVAADLRAYRLDRSADWVRAQAEEALASARKNEARKLANVRYFRSVAFGHGGHQIVESFDDTPPGEQRVFVTGLAVHVHMWSDILVVSALRVTQSDGRTATHGIALPAGESHQCHEFKLNEFEHVVDVQLRRGFFVDQVKFTTDEGRRFGPYGGRGGDEVDGKAEPDRGSLRKRDATFHLAGFRGNVVMESDGTRYLQSLAIVWAEVRPAECLASLDDD